MAFGRWVHGVAAILVGFVIESVFHQPPSAKHQPLFFTDLEAAGLVGQNGGGPAFRQTFDLQCFGRLQEVLKVFFGHLDFAMVHEFEDRVEVVLGDVS